MHHTHQSYCQEEALELAQMTNEHLLPAFHNNSWYIHSFILTLQFCLTDKLQRQLANLLSPPRETAPLASYGMAIKFKITTLAFKVLKTGQPPYLAQQLCPCAPIRALRCSTSKLLQVPCINLRFSSRSFCVSAPTLWNSLHHSVHFCESLTTFRKHLETFYFQSAFPAAPSDQPLRFNFWFLALYKFIYLLTYLLTRKMKMMCVCTLSGIIPG